MPGRGFVPDEERSYSKHFFVLVLLLAGVSAWCVVDEAWVRRPWKAVQRALQQKEETELKRLVAEARRPDAAAQERPTPPVADAEKRLAQVAAGGTSLEQLVVPSFERNEFGHLVDRVDRCVSCHPGSQVAISESGPSRLGAHPRRLVALPGVEAKRDALLGIHPPQRFGCTPCHEGQGLATTVRDAHGRKEPGHAPLPGWSKPLWDGKSIEAGCNSCHRSQLATPGAPLLNRGKELFRHLGCAACHSLGSNEKIAKIGPSLRRIGSKWNVSVLVAWLAKNQTAPVTTRMPSFRLERTGAKAIAAYLRASSQPFTPERAGQAGAGSLARGKVLLGTLGCAGCHDVDRQSAPARRLRRAFAPSLEEGARLRNAVWLYSWLKNPRGYDVAARMPDLRLTDGEARDLVAYLTNARVEATLNPAQVSDSELADPVTKETGRRLIVENGCAGCHEINGIDETGRSGPRLDGFARKELEELDFGNTLNAGFKGPRLERTWQSWVRHKLQTPAVYDTERIRLRMPDYQLSLDEVDALEVLLASLGPQPVDPYLFRPDSARESLDAGRELTERLNCRGCHSLEDGGGDILARYQDPAEGPPPLAGEGRKVRSEWLFSYMKAPESLRPWLRVRMPTVVLRDAEASALVGYFYAREGERSLYDFERPAPLTPTQRQSAEALFKIMKCLRCHTESTRKGLKTGELAPDLARTPARLRYRWIVGWLRDPQGFQRGTRMPTYFPLVDDDDPKSIYSQVPGIAGGDPLVQIELLSAFLFELPPRLQRGSVPPSH